MGRIVDVVVDRNGQVRAAVIDFGGFLGVGSRKIAVDWDALKFPTARRQEPVHVTLEFTRDQVKAGPEYQDGKPVVVLGPKASSSRFHINKSGDVGDVPCPRNRIWRSWRKAGPSRRHRVTMPPPDILPGPQEPIEPPPHPSRGTLRGFDWFIFFVADVQTGFGPFVSVYLTAQKWTQVDIGLVLSAAGLVASGGADSGRSPGRFRPLRATGGGHCGRGDQRQRARLCGLADIPGRSVRRRAALRRQLRARPGHRGDQSRIGRARGRRRAARPQCPLRVHRQRAGGGRDGGLRLFSLGPRRVLRHRAPARARPSRSSCNVGE